MRLLHIAACLLVCGTARAGERPDDGEIGRRLIGAWTTCLTSGDEVKADGTIRYAADGTFVAEGKVDLGDGVPVAVRVEGNWVVKGGAVKATVTKSSHPGLAPVGAAATETVVSIDDRVLRVKRGTGKERERTRVQVEPGGTGAVPG